MKTRVGTQVLETDRYIRNPKRGDIEDLDDLPESGYKRPFLAVWSKTQSATVIDLDTASTLTFDTDKWELVDHEDRIVVQKNE